MEKVKDNNSVNFILCDDERYILEKVTGYIHDVMMDNDYSYSIETFEKYDKSFFEMMYTCRVHKIYFLDIDVKGESGIDVARKIREFDMDSIIIFLTAHNSFASSVVKDKIMCLTYINKFEDAEKHIKSAILDSLKMMESKQILSFKENGVKFTIPINDILYIRKEKNERKLTIRTDYTNAKISRTIKDIKLELSSDFAESNRSCLINQKHVISIDKKKKKITFDNGEIIELLSDSFEN